MKSAWRWLVSEPMVHFLLAGALIYGAFAYFGPEPDAGASARRISVDRAALLQFMQYRAKAFEPETFAARFDALGAGERQALIDEYVREEVLYREAQSLGLGQGDDVMRQRLIQKMNFLLEEGSVAEPTGQQLEDYFREHQHLYAIAPAWTFTHVFIDPAARGEERARRFADRLLAAMSRERVGYAEATQYGDRYPFLQNYVERTPDYIASHFGKGFMQALEALPVGERRWLGPLRSDQGLHLVFIASKKPGRIPALDEIRDVVVDDFRRDQAAAAQRRAIDALVATYEVEISGSLAGQP